MNLHAAFHRGPTHHAVSQPRTPLGLTNAVQTLAGFCFPARRRSCCCSATTKLFWDRGRTGAVAGRGDVRLEKVVTRLGVEPGVTAVSWKIVPTDEDEQTLIADA